MLILFLIFFFYEGKNCKIEKRKKEKPQRPIVRCEKGSHKELLLSVDPAGWDGGFDVLSINIAYALLASPKACGVLKLLLDPDKSVRRQTSITSLKTSRDWVWYRKCDSLFSCSFCVCSLEILTSLKYEFLICRKRWRVWAGLSGETWVELLSTAKFHHCSQETIKRDSEWGGRCLRS